MSSGKNMQKMVYALERRGLMKSKEEHLLTPNRIQDIIVLANEGRTKDALFVIEKASRVFGQIENEVDVETREWYSEIIQQLRQAIHSSKSSTPAQCERTGST